MIRWHNRCQTHCLSHPILGRKHTTATKCTLDFSFREIPSLKGIDAVHHHPPLIVSRHLARLSNDGLSLLLGMTMHSLIMHPKIVIALRPSLRPILTVVHVRTTTDLSTMMTIFGASRFPVSPHNHFQLAIDEFLVR